VEITNLGFFRKILPFLNYATWVNKKIQKFDIEFQEAQQNHDIAKLEDLKHDIENFSPTEKSFAENLLQKIGNCISEYENNFKNEVERAINADKTAILIYIYEKYKENTYFQKFSLFEEVKNRLNHKDESTYRVAEKSKQITDYELYINDFKGYENAVYLSDAKQRIDQLKEFEKIQNSQDIGDFDLFLEFYPDNFLKDEVQKLKNDLQTEKSQKQYFEEIQKNPTIELCKTFLNDFGKDSEKRQKIHQILENLEFEQLKIDNSIEAYEKYLKKYSNGQFSKNASEILKKLRNEQEERTLFEQAKEHNNIENWRKYLYDTEAIYRTSENEIFAKQCLKELQNIREDNDAFEKAQKEDTKESYLEYMTNYKNGLHFQEAEKLYNKKYSGITDANELLSSKIDTLPNSFKESMNETAESITKQSEAMNAFSKEISSKMGSLPSVMKESMNETAESITKQSEAISSLSNTMEKLIDEMKKNQQKNNHILWGIGGIFIGIIIFLIYYLT